MGLYVLLVIVATTLLVTGTHEEKLPALAGLLLSGATLLLLFWRMVYTVNFAGLPAEHLVPRSSVRESLGWTALALLPERTAILAFFVLIATDFVYRAVGYELEDAPYIDSLRVALLGGVLVVGVVTSPNHLPHAVQRIKHDSLVYCGWAPPQPSS